jgi:hypothetical protein
MTYQPYPGGDAGGYQPYPDGPSQSPMQRGAAPGTVVNAVRLMYVGAAISLVGVILNIATAGSLKTRVHNANKTLTPTQVANVAHIELAFIIVLGLLGVGLWIWMAFMCRAGRNWARITGTVFFGIFTLLLLVSAGRTGGGLGLIPDLILWLVGLGAVVLLWRKDASAFFRQQYFS